ncbi:MAG: FG-GAP repeat protein [Anaerolineales bacterium]|nr:FG-GAP repeat protein [Anaerolineales bacterium]
MTNRQPWFVLGLIILGVMVFVAGSGRFMQTVLDAQTASLPAGDAFPNEIEGWWQPAINRLATREYQFSRLADGQLGAPNRAQGFRASLGDSGLTLAARTSDDWSASLSWHNGAISRDGQAALLQNEAGELRLENDSLGLKQRYAVAGRADLSWQLALAGLDAAVSADGQQLQLQNMAGKTVLSLNLLALEAAGQGVTGRFVLDGAALTIATDATGPLALTLNAQSPDGLSTTPVWTTYGLNHEDQYGLALNAAGDIDNNGYVDVIVGAPFYDTGAADAGAVFIYHNDAAGLPITPTLIISGTNIGGWFGRSVAGAGNVNGDEYADIVIGAPGELNLSGLARVGVTHVYLGSASGISLTSGVRSFGAANGNLFGYSVAGAGDVDFDGYDDIVVGSPGSQVNGQSEGSIHLFYGSISGTAAVADWSFHCQQLGCDLGVSVSGAGNVNGDDYADFVAGAIHFDSNHVYPGGAYDEGAALVFHGSSAGPGSTPDQVLQPGVTDSQSGFAVAGIGDVNGDGFDDIGIGAPGAAGITSTVYVYHGSSSPSGGTPAWSATGVFTNSSLGFAVAPAGDIDGDGFDDLIVGDNQIKGLEGPGAAYVFRGTPYSLETAAAWQVIGEGDGYWLGGSVAGAMDLNNDGYDDVLVGSPQYGEDPYPGLGEVVTGTVGAAFAYLGGPVDPITGLVLTHTLPTWADVPIQFDAIISTGQSVTYTWNLGDGTQFSSYSATISHIYEAQGWYTVTVRASNLVSVMTTTQVLSVTKTYFSFLPIVVKN